MTTPFKLYYTPTSCGAANFLAATIGDLAFDSETVDLRTHKTKSGTDYYTINPKGNVPTIVFPDGSILNENVATLTYLADKGNAGLAPKEGSQERYAYLNDVGFVASELHPAYGALFNPNLTPELREAATNNARRRVDKLVGLLDGGKKPFLNGKSLSAADLYAFIVLGWSKSLGVNIPPAAQAYVDGISKLDKVTKAKAAMASASA
ncbi:MAG: glutathione transferase GstA [Polyangiaceae bacterium]|nr:glutathione transferase GstA [Polyangiaceae bacterium]